MQESVKHQQAMSICRAEISRNLRAFFLTSTQILPQKNDLSDDVQGYRNPSPSEVAFLAVAQIVATV